MGTRVPADRLLAARPDLVVEGVVYWRDPSLPLPDAQDAERLARLTAGIPRVLWFPTPETTRSDSAEERAKNRRFVARNEDMRRWSTWLGMLFLPLDTLERALRPFGGTFRQTGAHWLCGYRGFNGYEGESVMTPIYDAGPAACREDFVNMALVRAPCRQAAGYCRSILNAVVGIHELSEEFMPSEAAFCSSVHSRHLEGTAGYYASSHLSRPPQPFLPITITGANDPQLAHPSRRPLVLGSGTSARRTRGAISWRKRNEFLIRQLPATTAAAATAR